MGVAEDRFSGQLGKPLDAALADCCHRAMDGVPFLVGLPGGRAWPKHGVTARVPGPTAGLSVTDR
jgi:hypothetical protein